AQPVVVFAPRAPPLAGVDTVQPLLIVVPPDVDVQLAQPVFVFAPRVPPLAGVDAVQPLLLALPLDAAVQLPVAFAPRARVRRGSDARRAPVYPRSNSRPQAQAPSNL